MLIAQRRHRILEETRARGFSSFQELASALDISESTIRRDARAMVAEGLLAATRGGVSTPAVTADGSAGAPERPVTDADRLLDSAPDPVAAERDAIAARAVSLVRPGSAILLGPGRTTHAMALRLGTVGPLTVVTNSVLVTSALAHAPQVDVVMVGGALRRSIGALVGPIAEHNLKGLRGAQVFLSGEGVTADQGLTTPNVFAAATDQALVAAARDVVVLADHTKVGRETMCQTVSCERIDVLVTDDKADRQELRRLAAAGVDVQLGG
jgi:DeoR/GlpR family transcriptional regulator of sugar metabolism